MGFRRSRNTSLTTAFLFPYGNYSSLFDEPPYFATMSLQVNPISQMSTNTSGDSKHKLDAIMPERSLSLKSEKNKISL
jgi:hypothetical protein